MTHRQQTHRNPGGSAGLPPILGRGAVNSLERDREPVWGSRSDDAASTSDAPVGVVAARRRRYLSARGVVSVIALASLVVPGIVAVIAAAVAAF